MNRLVAFNSFESHGWLKKAFSRLRAEEADCARNFISLHDGLDKGRFEMAVNRMFIDKPKPKNWTIILELLTCANSRAG